MVLLVLSIVILLTSVTTVNGKQNCSLYNPCGRNGYCRDTTDGVTCECKFWWNGTLCDEQTNSGKQVITLGCLLAALIGIFYGLKIGHTIRRWRKQPKVVKKKEIIYETTLVDLVLHNARRSARVSSCIVTVLTMIVAPMALLAKWSIIRPIHDVIVTKYLTNQSIYYDENPFCEKTLYTSVNVITFPVSCLMILLFIIRTKRTSCCPDQLRGYIAPPIPVDFISHVDRKFAAVVFAVCADELLYILQEALNGSSSKGDGVIVTYLLRLLQVLVMGFHYYPLLAAVYIHSIFTLACATLYAWFDYAITIVYQGMCTPDFYPSYENYLENSSSISIMLDFYGTGANLIAVQLCTDIPRYVCLAYISVKLPIMLIKKIRRRLRRDITSEERLIMKLTREQRIFFRISRPESVEMLYVRNLFRSADRLPPSHALWARLIPKMIYYWRDDFRFSTRVLCVYSSMALLLYFVTIQACIRVLPYLKPAQDFIQKLSEAIFQLIAPNPSAVDDGNTGNSTQPINAVTTNFPVPQLIRPYLFAVFLTMIIIIIQLLVLLANIRRNLCQSFRGDDSEIPRRRRAQYVSYASGNIHFAGYFIGYLVWGFILVAVFAMIICVAVDAFITFGSVRIIEIILKAAIPSLLFLLFKQYLNKLLAQYVFLQHQGNVLALNNRRLLMIFIFFNFFLDAFLGFISSVMRLIKSVIGGMLYMCRLDYSPLGRKLETIDGGFSAYCGFIHTECAHRHPVMLVFVAHLYTQLKLKQWKRKEQTFLNLSKGGRMEPPKPNPSSKYIRKWKLIVFLIRNPTVVFFRKAFLSQLRIEEVHALNDIDDNKRENMQRRLSVYTRRMSVARGSVVSNTLHNEIKTERF